MLAALCLVALAVAPISPASAAFVWGDAHQLDFGQRVSDMSCPIATQCTVVGATNDATTFAPQTTGNAHAVPIASSGAYGGISCWSATQCTAVGDGREVTFNPQSPNSPTPSPHATVDATTGVDLVSISCPAANQCSAVDGASGNEVTFDPTNATAQTPNPVDTHGDLTSVTCPTTTECVTVDTGGWEATFDPTGVAATSTQEVGLPNGNNGTRPSLSAVVCPTADQCSASANNGSVANFDPNDVSANHPQFLSATQYHGMACPTTTLCVTASAHSGLVSFNPHGGGVPSLTFLGVLGQGPIVCATASRCTASNGEGATTFDPGGSSNVIQTSFTPAVTGISCSSSTSCSFGDLGGNFLSVTPQSHTLAAADVAGGSILDVSCPSAIQCTVAQANGYVRTFNPEQVGASTLKYITASAEVTALDCPTVTTCALGESNGFATTFDPQTQSLPQGTYRLDPGQAIQSISCADDMHCVAVDSAGAETSFNPQTPRDLAPVTVDPGTPLVAVSCPADAQCTAVDGIGQEVTFDPSTTIGATPISIDPGSELGAIACPATNLCLAVDSAGRSLAGDPQDAATAWDVEPVPGTSVLTGISCSTEGECSAVDSGGEYSLGNFVAVPTVDALPTISGAPVVGQTLTETHATWSGLPTTFAYQWEDCGADGLGCAPIADGVSASYTVAATDAGDTIRVVETADNAGGHGAPAASAPTAVVLEPSNTTSSTTTTGSSTTTAPMSPPVTQRPPGGAQVRAALRRILAPAGAGARITALLKARGYTFTFNAPSAGKLALAWYRVPRGAHLTGATTTQRGPRPIRMASVNATITKAGKVKVTIELSPAGRTRLRSTAKSLKLTGQGSFTPAGSKRTTVRRTFSVRR